MRSYWRNYFEKTDALIWVVDATDRLRVDDCREELAGLLLEEVNAACQPHRKRQLTNTAIMERLMGASLLVFANKTDVGGCMTREEIQEVCSVRKTGLQPSYRLTARFMRRDSN